MWPRPALTHTLNYSISDLALSLAHFKGWPREPQNLKIFGPRLRGYKTKSMLIYLDNCSWPCAYITCSITKVYSQPKIFFHKNKNNTARMLQTCLQAAHHLLSTHTHTPCTSRPSPEPCIHSFTKPTPSPTPKTHAKANHNRAATGQKYPYPCP